MPTHIASPASTRHGEPSPPTLASTQRLSELALQSGQLGSWSLHVATQQAVRSLRHDQIFGYTELHPTWTYATFLDHVNPEDRERVDTEYRKALEDGTDWEFEARIHRVDGEERWIWAKGKHFRDDSGSVVEIVGLVADITDRKRTEVALRKSEQLAAVGRLASTIAHEINNPLESVTNLLYLAGTANDLEEARGYIRTAESELQRVSTITNQTLRFQRTKAVLRRVTPLELLSGISEMFCGRLTNHAIRLTQRHLSGRTTLCFDGEVRQVLTNLIGNAIDSMSKGGHLTVRSRNGRSREGVDGILIAVSDTGTGISKAVAQKMYDPFFSTKGQDGSGLGLWVSLDIVHRHHGTLTMRSSEAVSTHGTVFRLFLPADRQPLAATQA